MWEAGRKNGPWVKTFLFNKFHQHIFKKLRPAGLPQENKTDRQAGRLKLIQIMTLNQLI